MRSLPNPFRTGPVSSLSHRFNGPFNFEGSRWSPVPVLSQVVQEGERDREPPEDVSRRAQVLLPQREDVPQLRRPQLQPDLQHLFGSHKWKGMNEIFLSFIVRNLVCIIKLFPTIIDKYSCLTWSVCSRQAFQSLSNVCRKDTELN
jgi:hypothetical protein